MLQLHTKIIFILLLMIGLSGLSSCKTIKLGKNKARKPSIPMLEEKLVENSFDPEWFSARAKVKFRENESTPQTFNIDIRMKKDSAIWLSASPAIGIKIEVARAIITPGRVQVLDRFHKKYYDKDFDFIRQYIDYPLDFETLQTILFGQSIVTQGYTDAQAVGEQYRLSSEDCTLFLDGSNFSIMQMIWENKQLERSIIANFETYEEVGGNQFSNKRNYLMKNGDNYSVNIQFSKLKVDEPLEFPFKVSSKYEEVK